MRLFTVLSFVMLALSVFSQTRVGEAKLNMQHVGHHGTHSEHYIPADAPDVYFDSDELEITIVADGFSSYYDVVIEDYYTGVVVISTQISGYGDSIDVSSLSAGNYTITITTSYNNVFVGQFTI